MSHHKLVTSEQRGAVALVTINRPEAFNALNAEVLDGIHSAMTAAERDQQIRCVVLTGAGQKAFCAGADLKELDGLGVEAAHDVMSRGQQIMSDIDVAQTPVIAAVNGLALGGGFELVLASTFAVMSTRAQLGLPESGLGLIPGYGGTQRLPRAIGAPNAAYVMLTGERLSADRAYGLGLTPLPPVEPEQLLDVALGLADRIAAQGPRAVRSILRALATSRDADLASGLRLETELAAQAVAGAESSEGISAFIHKRPADFSQGSPEGGTQ